MPISTAVRASTVVLASTAVLASTGFAVTPAAAVPPRAPATWCEYSVTAPKLAIRQAPAGKIISTTSRGKLFFSKYGTSTRGYKYGWAVSPNRLGWVAARHLKRISCTWV